MIYFTNKNTNEVFGYESMEEAKVYNDDFENLVEMTDEQFNEFRNNQIKYGKWVWDKGWVIDETLVDEENLLNYETELYTLKNIKAEMVTENKENLLLNKEDNTRSSAEELDTIDKEIEELENKIKDLREKLNKK